MNAITEKILHDVKELSDDMQQEALDFIHFLRKKNQIVQQKKPNGEEISKILGRIASRGSAFSKIDDPISWQRKIRKDRPLPFRND